MQMQMEFDQLIRHNRITLSVAEPIVKTIRRQEIIDAFWNFKRINDDQIAKLRELALASDADLTPEKLAEFKDYFNRTNVEAREACDAFRELWATLTPQDFNDEARYKGRYSLVSVLANQKIAVNT